MAEKKRSIETLKKKLLMLYENQLLDPSVYSWISESDRWAEFVFSLLSQFDCKKPEEIVVAVTVLKDLGLLDVKKLAGLEKDDQNKFVSVFVLKQHGFTERSARRAINCLSKISKVIMTDYNGKIQRFLRFHGKMMRDELVSAFKGKYLSKSSLRFAVSQWLQNALSLPISREQPEILQFCTENEVSMDDLWQAADELNWNLSFVDDLISLSQSVKLAASKGEE